MDAGLSTDPAHITEVHKGAFARVTVLCKQQKIIRRRVLSLQLVHPGPAAHISLKKKIVVSKEMTK